MCVHLMDKLGDMSLNVPPEVIAFVKDHWNATANQMHAHLTQHFLPDENEFKRDGTSTLEKYWATSPNNSNKKGQNDMKNFLHPVPVVMLNQYKDFKAKGLKDFENDKASEGKAEAYEKSKIIKHMIDVAYSSNRYKSDWTHLKDDKVIADFEVTGNDLFTCAGCHLRKVDCEGCEESNLNFTDTYVPCRKKNTPQCPPWELKECKCIKDGKGAGERTERLDDCVCGLEVMPECISMTLVIRHRIKRGAMEWVYNVCMWHVQS